MDEVTGRGHQSYVHVRVQQRTTRKYITICEGLDQKLNFKRIIKALRKAFSCNGSIAKHPELGNVIQLQGDHRDDIFEFLTKTGICSDKNIKIHGAT